MTSSSPTGIEMSEQVKYCGIAQPSWTMISPTDQCLTVSTRKRESQLISSNIKALSIQSACKPEKRTRSRARMSLDAQESKYVIAMAKTNENRTVMCWNMKHYCRLSIDSVLELAFVLRTAEMAFRFYD